MHFEVPEQSARTFQMLSTNHWKNPFSAIILLNI